MRRRSLARGARGFPWLQILFRKALWQAAREPRAGQREIVSHGSGQWGHEVRFRGPNPIDTRRSGAAAIAPAGGLGAVCDLRRNCGFYFVDGRHHSEKGQFPAIDDFLIIDEDLEFAVVTVLQLYVLPKSLTQLGRRTGGMQRGNSIPATPDPDSHGSSCRGHTPIGCQVVLNSMKSLMSYTP